MTQKNNFVWFIVQKKTLHSVFTFSKDGGKLIFSIIGDDFLPAHLETIGKAKYSPDLK
jgi:hypothetical protein